jgi:hypothetical protein
VALGLYIVGLTSVEILKSRGYLLCYSIVESRLEGPLVSMFLGELPTSG